VKTEGDRDGETWRDSQRGERHRDTERERERQREKETEASMCSSLFQTMQAG
jgi:hypothetical protein